MQDALIALVLVETFVLGYVLFRWTPRSSEPRARKPFASSVPRGYQRPPAVPVPHRRHSAIPRATVHVPLPYNVQPPMREGGVL